MARWFSLSAEEYCGLAMRAIGDAWEPWEHPPPHLLEEAVFSKRGSEPPCGGWEHHVLRAKRDGHTYIHVHRFSLPAEAERGKINDFLSGLALQKESEVEGCSRSNVGGFHSADDLWRWSEMECEIGCRVFSLMQSAMLQVEQYEKSTHETHAANGVSSAAIVDVSSAAVEEPLRTQEAWLNVSRVGNWNHFHTHPGSTFSGCYYASDAALPASNTCECKCGAEALQGRLVLLTQAPDSVSEHSQNLVHASLEPEEESFGKLVGREDLPKCVLIVDPTPGSLIIFPSFVPHFVLPLGLDSVGCALCRSSESTHSSEVAAEHRVRISMALNFITD
eukprot:TRINITY_DN14477_c0_g1_i1.p1 TRINITY_DN14477_c0_g1~~TRINITY_DN14477_c0_g1_i1.p1  ORF type:complete len:334 (+),score=50.93 TRINITY_DN14477_c0_g1_i1:199-1200(+)